MSETPLSDGSETAPASTGEEKPLPEDLPPVEPPSAGFIVQLFLVPALIVLVVVGIWALFGKLASGEQNWRTLVSELRHSNEHRRWRGALGLAQILQLDMKLGPQGEQLARHADIARELSELLRRELKRPTQREDDLKQRAFLARTLSMLDVPETVIPVLEQAMRAEHDREIRKNAIASIAVIAGRTAARGERLQSPSLVAELIEISADRDPLMRQLAAYALGLMPTAEARERLSVLLEDADGNTRVNAAVGLARQKSTEGLCLFRKVFVAAAKPVEADTSKADKLQLVVLQNALKAVEVLTDELTAHERREFVGLIEPIATGHGDARIRIEAQKTLQTLREHGR